jgi:hypothetical protein
VCLCFFFKQKTAYEMCGRDWSSDVCSSDLDDVRSRFADEKKRYLELTGKKPMEAAPAAAPAPAPAAEPAAAAPTSSKPAAPSSKKPAE